jgi:AcrR family transcriptional regulator
LTTSLTARRTALGSARTGGRSERVVCDVLGAAAHEVAHSGYAALRIDDVATRAGVNKTTVYRRWPTKARLIGAMLAHYGSLTAEPPDTGSIQGDLLALCETTVSLASSPIGRAAARLVTTDLDDAEVRKLIRAQRVKQEAPWLEVIERAIARGELRPGTNARLITEVLRATIFSRLFRRRQPVDRAFLQGLVGLLLGQAVPRPIRRRRTSNGT